MPTAKRTRKAKKPAAKPDKSIDQLVGYCNEGETIDVPQNFGEYTSLFYGESGVGKTSTVAKSPGSYVIQCDPQRKGLSIRQTNIPNISLVDQTKNQSEFTPWEIMEATFGKILLDNSVETVIIDNMRFFYNHVCNHLLSKNHHKTLADFGDWGQAWNVVDEMYADWFNKLTNIGKGLIFVCHQKELETELADGTKKTTIMPDVTGRMFQSIRAMTDFAFYMNYNSDGDRVITLRHDSNDIWYKCCTDDENQKRFCDPDGNTVNRISAGNSATEAWSNLMKSWNNEIYDVDYRPPREKKRRRSK